MNHIARPLDARTTPTQFAESRGRKIAYRILGQGPAMILCLRFRGVMDDWDPAFLDTLARHFTVITFDYSGLGQSTGTASYRRKAMAEDAKDLADALGLERVVIAGWSIGGIAAQIFTATYPQLASHAVLIGTVPPGEQKHQIDPIFLPTALKPVYDLTDEYILFFDPASEKSRAAADASHERIQSRNADRSPPIPKDTFVRILKESSDPRAVFPDDGRYQAFFEKTDIPVLVISGDREIVFPVENWHALNGKWPTLHLVNLPQAGHGPQHQYPEFSAEIIASFVRNA